MAQPDQDPDRAKRLARVKRLLLLAIFGYLGVLAAIGLGVWGATGSVAAGLLTVLGLSLMMPWIATAGRAAHQKRNGLPVRGYWNSRPSSGGST